MRSDIFRRDAPITKAILPVTNGGYCRLTVLSPKNTFKRQRASLPAAIRKHYFK